MTKAPSPPIPLHVIEGDVERFAEHILTEYLVDSCVKIVAEEAEGRLQIGYGIRRGNDFIVIRMPYTANDEAKYAASDKRWTLEMDNKIIGEDYLELGDALDAAGIFKRTQ
jgi:hypothetical protein